MSELTASHSTLEKAREVTNCPDGVDLQDHLKQLVAENVALKSISVKLYNYGYLNGHHHTVEGYFTDIHRSDIDTYHSDVVEEIIDEETPATDSILRAAEARGVDSGIDTLMSHLNHQHPAVEQAIHILRIHANRLREGKA